ncbi:hypothetical protein N7461_005899 [Penicillium sp. DV-2018c]|nr:hypothetical protein N7461_005899 [Penicillium sp. DV-2018c]
MPSFFVPGHHGLPTPPHVNGGRMEDPSFYPVGHAGFPPRYHQSGNEFIEQYTQSLGYGKPLSVNTHHQSAHQMNNARDHQMNQSGLFNPMVGSALPAMRHNVHLPPMDAAIPPQYRRQETAPMQQPEQPRKEEKATGGVAAHLDYEMEHMSDFVAEMAQGMYDLFETNITLADIDLARSIHPGSSVPPPFRKYVFQILSSTRLPSATILLGLFYLASRMRLLSAKRNVTKSDSSLVYRMLTVALLLGSKFLDDNTFQNKSWAEVSNIPVAELNRMELEWLFAFDWKIHDCTYDKEDGFNSWRAHWDTWRAKATARAQEPRQTLAPLETNIIRGQSVVKPLMSPEGPIPPQYQRSSQIENSWLNPTASEYSPPPPAPAVPLPLTTILLVPGVTTTRLLPRPTRGAGMHHHSTWLTHLGPNPRLITIPQRTACHSHRHIEHYMCTSAFPSMQQPMIAT